MCRGMMMDGHEGKERGSILVGVVMFDFGSRSGGAKVIGEEERRRRKSAAREGSKGRKNGIERKWL